MGTKNEEDFALYLEEGKKKFGCDLRITQTWVGIAAAKDDTGALIMVPGIKCAIEIAEVKPQVDVATTGDRMRLLEGGQNGG